jgi:hypothetical protein
MPSYLIEVYVPRARTPEVGSTGRRIRAAIEELHRDGVDMRYVRTMILPDDETCFHVLDAPSTAEVERVCERAGVERIRVVSAIEEPPEASLAGVTSRGDQVVTDDNQGEAGTMNR